MKALAANCSKSATIKKYDQLSVAQHQLEGAIANLFLGNWPSAITLAGAAEEVLPEHANFKDLMSIAKDDVAKQHGVTSKQISDIMNKKRNWLKHDKSNDPNSEMIVDFSQEDAIIMIIRALTKVMAHHAPFAKDEVLSEHILVFDDWCKRNYPEFSVPSFSAEQA